MHERALERVERQKHEAQRALSSERAQREGKTIHIYLFLCIVDRLPIIICTVDRFAHIREIWVGGGRHLLAREGTAIA